MQTSITEISLLQLSLSTAYVLTVLIIVKRMGLHRNKTIIVASFRMIVQLILAGFVLIYLFANPSSWSILLVYLLMQTFAVFNTFKRVKVPLTNQLKKLIAISLIVGSTISLIYFLIIVVGNNVWNKPQYFIPLAGMIIGNAMTGISLAINRLVDGMHTERDLIEGALMLGATTRDASKSVVNKAFDAAILPTLNSMIGMGIVILPGMMTGQILSGVAPFTAIKYQIAIMFGILGGVALSLLLFINYGYKVFFNKEAQLILPSNMNEKREN